MASAHLMRSRKRGPGEDEWKRIKDKFERLYILEGLSLDRISAKLAVEDNFHAEKWRLKKNFKNQELEAVAKTVEPFLQAGLRAPTAVIDQRVVPMDRAKRHFKECFQPKPAQGPKGISLNSSPSISQSNASSAQGSKMRTRGHRRLECVPRVLLQQSDESHSFEATLIQVNNYFAWRLTVSDDYILHRMQPVVGSHAVVTNMVAPADVLEFAIGGIVAFDKGDVQLGQKLIKRFCAQATTFILQQHTYVLDVLFCYAFWYNFRINRMMCGIFFFLSSLSRRLLGPIHPITMVLQILSSPDQSQNTKLLMLKLMGEIAMRQGESCSELLFEIECGTVDALIEDDFTTASEFCERLLRRYVGEFDEKHPYCRKLLLRLADVHSRHNHLAKAESILLRVLALDASYEQDTPLTDWISFCAAEQLGIMCAYKKDLSGARIWHSRALEGYRRVCGSENPATQIVQLRSKKIQEELAQQTSICAPSLASTTESEESEEEEIDFLADLEQEIVRLGLEEVDETLPHPAPWNEWKSDHNGGQFEGISGIKIINVTGDPGEKGFQGPWENEVLESTSLSRLSLDGRGDESPKDCNHGLEHPTIDQTIGFQSPPFGFPIGEPVGAAQENLDTLVNMPQADYGGPAPDFDWVAQHPIDSLPVLDGNFEFDSWPMEKTTDDTDFGPMILDMEGSGDIFLDDIFDINDFE